MKIWNKYLGLLLAGLTLLVCCITVLVAYFSHRQDYSAAPFVAQYDGNSNSRMPVGPFLSAAFDTIRSGTRLAGFHIPEHGGEMVESLLAYEESPLHSPVSAFTAAKKIEESVESVMRNDAFDLADGQNSQDDGVVELADGRAGEGDSLASVLAGLEADNSKEYAKAAKKAFSARSLRHGQLWRAFADAETGRLARFEYEIDASRLLVVEGDENPVGRIEKLDYDIALERIEGVINDNLFSAMAEIGENPQLADSLAKLFGSEINFLRQLDSGDSFALLVEKKYRHGEFRQYGRILAARLVNRGKLHEAYLFRDESGRAQYFNEKGENLHKTLLQAPLAVTRTTSRFSEARLHPILNVVRPHLGVDYGAPHGTPVKAVGDGTVTERGWSGGYGNLLVLAHPGGLESMYAHLSGFARGIQPGKQVRQGQVIGFVGSTGLATGPHLDFRLRKNGEFINPEKVVNPRAAPVSKRLKKEYENVLAEERACLDGEIKIENYRQDSIISPVLANFEETHVAESKKTRAESRQEKFRRKLLARKAALRNAWWVQKRAMSGRKAFSKSRVSSPSREASHGERASAAKKQKKRS